VDRLVCGLDRVLLPIAFLNPLGFQLLIVLLPGLVCVTFKANGNGISKGETLNIELRSINASTSDLLMDEVRYCEAKHKSLRPFDFDNPGINGGSKAVVRFELGLLWGFDILNQKNVPERLQILYSMRSPAEAKEPQQYCTLQWTGWANQLDLLRQVW